MAAGAIATQSTTLTIPIFMIVSSFESAKCSPTAIARFRRKGMEIRRQLHVTVLQKQT